MDRGRHQSRARRIRADRRCAAAGGARYRRPRWPRTPSAGWSRCWTELPPARAARIVASVSGVARDVVYARALALKPESKVEETRRLEIEHGLRRAGSQDASASARCRAWACSSRPAGPALRLSSAQFVAGAHRVLPLEIGKTRRAERLRPGEDVVAHEAHRHAAGLPAAGDEALPLAAAPRGPDRCGTIADRTRARTR